LGDFEGEG
jgi:hypothetical protein